MKQSILLLLLLCSVVASAQSYKGIVVDQATQKPLVGAAVFWQGTTNGTITDQDGKYKIVKPTPEQHMLVVSYVGYRNDTIHAHGAEVNFALLADNTISDVNVVQHTAASTMSMLTANQTQTITGKELSRAACCNLSESFETNASVDVSYADAVSGIKQIQMLGLSGKYSQLTMALIPTLRGAESAFGLEYYPGTWINSVQISKGNSAVKTGYESITGQINIGIKEPSMKERMFFNTYGNQDGKAELNLGYVYDLNDKWSTSLMVHGSGNFREMDENDDGFLDKPLSKLGIVMNQWNYHGEKYESKFGFSYLQDSREGGQKAYDHDKLASEQSAYGMNVDVKRFNAFAKNGFILDREATSIGTILSYNYFDRNSFYGHNIFNVTQQNFYANFIYQSYIADTRHTYNVGASFAYDDNDAYFNQQANYDGYKESTTGVFAEYNFIPSEQFTLLLGMRYDYSTLYDGFITPRIHAKYNVNDKISFRASAGKGYRTPDAMSENSQYLASSKQFIFDEEVEQEEAWNYGVSMVNSLSLLERNLSLSLEFYRTDFENQLIADMDQNSHEIHFYNLDGKSYSNIYQIEANYELFHRFDLTAAYRYNDVEATYNNELRDAPFTSKYKGLLSASYRTNLDKWQFDYTVQFNGDQRLPSTANNSAANQRADRSDSYVVMLAQVTKNYRNWSFYVGGENLASYTQDNAIISADDPFGSDFDASRLWAPLYGRMFYAGIKYNINKKSN